MTDVVSTYWTVVFESETPDIAQFFAEMRIATTSPELKDIMKGYMDFIEGGKREIFMIE